VERGQTERSEVRGEVQPKANYPLLHIGSAVNCKLTTVN